jgi:hypothetical protein
MEGRGEQVAGIYYFCHIDLAIIGDYFHWALQNTHTHTCGFMRPFTHLTMKPANVM